MPARVLAIDGGQTGTRAIVAAATGQLEGVGIAGPSTDLREFDRALDHAVAKAPPVDAVVLGLTGVGISDAADDAYRDAVIAATGCTNVVLESDVYTALVGATGGGDGVLVVGGGGALAVGVSGNTRVRAGGLGPLLIDEGSGYWVGVEAIRASWKAVEGWGPRTALVEAVGVALGVPHIYDAKRRLHSGDIGFTEIASLAQVVDEVARRGDQVAEQLLTCAGQSLAQLALAALRAATWTSRPGVYTSGRLLQSSRDVARAFRLRLQADAPGVRLKSSKYPAIVGAAIVAFRQAGASPEDQALQSLSAQWSDTAAGAG